MGNVLIILYVAMAGGPTQEIRLNQTFASIDACKAAIAGAMDRYKREHPDAEVKGECRES